jgi:hypothetical protein
MGSLLEFESPAGVVLFTLYITGDTLVFDDIRDIPRRYPDVDLALLHLGGTRVLDIMVTRSSVAIFLADRTKSPRLASKR